MTFGKAISKRLYWIYTFSLPQRGKEKYPNSIGLGNNNITHTHLGVNFSVFTLLRVTRDSESWNWKHTAFLLYGWGKIIHIQLFFTCSSPTIDIFNPATAWCTQFFLFNRLNLIKIFLVQVELTMHDGTVRDVCFIEDTSNKTSLLVSGGAGDCKIYVTDCATGNTFQVSMLNKLNARLSKR